MSDADVLVLLLAFGLAVLCCLLAGANAYWRGELRDYKAGCLRPAQRTNCLYQRT